MFRLSRELFAQRRILGGHPNRAGIEVALTHHDAPLHHQRSSRKAELIGAQQRADGDITAGLHLAIGLHPDTTAQAIEHQRLLGFGQTNFPWTSGMFDG